MGDFSLRGGSQKYESIGADLTTTLGTAVVCGANDAKGAWVEITASTSFDYEAIRFIAMQNTTASHFIDIGIGAAASEQVLISNLDVSSNGKTYRQAEYVELPISIPAGTRIACRGQTSLGSNSTMNVYLVGKSNTFSQSGGLGKAVTYGANTGATEGVTVDPGGTINTKGAYTEVTASTTADMKHLVLCIGSLQNASQATTGWFLDIAIGSAGNEEVICPNSHVQGDSVPDNLGPSFHSWDVDIPLGTRIAIRSQCDTNNATDRLLGALIIGIV